MGVPKGLQRGPKRPKTAFLGPHIPRQPFLTCETVSMHRPGCALTCFTFILHCSISPEPPDPIMAPKCPFWAIWGPFGVLMGPPNGTPDPRNGSNASLGMCPDLFHLYSTLFRQSGATTPPYGYKMTILGHLGPFWGPFGAPIGPQKGPNWSHQIRLWPKKAVFGRFGPFWEPSGTPRWPSLTPKTVPKYHHGYALTCSTLTPHCSTSSEPPAPLMAQKGRFLPFWTLFFSIIYLT